MYKVMILEDDPGIRLELGEVLELQGYVVSAPADIEEGIGSLAGEESHLVLLDINLPGQDGYAVCRRIRRITQIPVVFVTGRTADEDELKSILYGGDAFIRKPYNITILLAKIDSLLKKTYQSKENYPSMRGIVLHLPSGNLIYKGKSYDLTRNEFRILSYLFSHKDEIVFRLDLIEYLWDNEIFIDDNTLSVNMSRLRKKLEDIGIQGLILTKPKQGYLLDSHGSDTDEI